MEYHVGGCYCGAVRYRVEGLSAGSVCYCENCRKAVGAQSVVWAACAQNAYAVTQGEPTRFTAPNGALWTFCGTCGTTLTWSPGTNADFLTVTVGSLDAPASVPLESASWEEDRLPWDTLRPSGGRKGE